MNPAVMIGAALVAVGAIAAFAIKRAPRTERPDRYRCPVARGLRVRLVLVRAARRSRRDQRPDASKKTKAHSSRCPSWWGRDDPARTQSAGRTDNRYRHCTMMSGAGRAVQTRQPPRSVRRDRQLQGPDPGSRRRTSRGPVAEFVEAVSEGLPTGGGSHEKTQISMRLTPTVSLLRARRPTRAWGSPTSCCAVTANPQYASGFTMDRRSSSTRTTPAPTVSLAGSRRLRQRSAERAH